MNDKSSEQIVKNVIQHLKKVRLDKGLSHQKLADQIGLHRSALSLIESGKRQPTFLNCIKIAKALEVNLGDLIEKS